MKQEEQGFLHATILGGKVREQKINDNPSNKHCQKLKTEVDRNSKEVKTRRANCSVNSHSKQ